MDVNAGRDRIGTSIARITFTADNYNLPDNYSEGSIDPDEGGTRIDYSYSGLTYSWTFSDGQSASGRSVTHSYSISAGVSKWIGASVSITCTEKKVTTTVTIEEIPHEAVTKEVTTKDAEGNDVTETVVVTEAYVEKIPHTDTDTDYNYNYPIDSDDWDDIIYTRPTRWTGWDIPIGDNIYIEDYVNSTKLGQFLTQLGKYKSWYNQSDCYGNYDDYTLTSDEHPNNITAKGYNSIANLVGVSHVTAGQTVIAKHHFKDLADAVY